MTNASQQDDTNYKINSTGQQQRQILFSYPSLNPKIKFVSQQCEALSVINFFVLNPEGAYHN